MEEEGRGGRVRGKERRGMATWYKEPKSTELGVGGLLV